MLAQASFIHPDPDNIININIPAGEDLLPRAEGENIYIDKQ